MEFLLSQLDALQMQKSVLFHFEQKQYLSKIEQREKEIKIMLNMVMPKWKKHTFSGYEMYDNALFKIENLCKKLAKVLNEVQYVDKKKKALLEQEKINILQEIELLESEIGDNYAI